MKNIMKYICLLAMMMVAVPMMGQDYLTVHLKDGRRDSHKLSLMDKSYASKIDKNDDSHSEYQTFNIIMKDGRKLQYSFEEFDSISYTKFDEKEFEEVLNSTTNALMQVRNRASSLQEMASRIEDVKQISYVEDAYVSGNSLFVNVKGGMTIMFTYTPPTDKIKLESLSKKIKKISQLVSKNIPKINNNHKIVIANSQSDDAGRQALVDYLLLPLRDSLNNLGFDVKYEPIVGLDFYERGMYEYNSVFLDTHGSYDGNRHWLYTNDAIAISSNKQGAFELKNFKASNYDFDQYRIGVIGEKRMNEHGELDSVYVVYKVVSDKLIYNTNAHFRQGNNNIFFNVGCETLKGDLKRVREFDDLPYTADFSMSAALMQKGVNKYFGYTETNCLGQWTGFNLFMGLLNGKSVHRAYRDLESESLFEDKNINSDYENAVLLSIPMSSPEAERLFLVPTCTESVTSEQVVREFSESQNVTITGATSTIDSEHEAIDLLFSYSTNRNMSDSKIISANVIPDRIGDNGNLYFSAKIRNLQPNTTYYYQAKTYDGYAYNEGEICSFTTPSDIKLVTSLTFTSPTTTMDLCEVKSIEYHFTPIDADNKTMEWTSSDPSIVTVDQNGIATAFKTGTCTITVKTTDGSNLSASCVITVKEQKPEAYIRVAGYDLMSTSSGGTVEQIYQSNVQCEVTTNVDWITVLDSIVGSLNLTPNPYNNRSGYITITNEEYGLKETVKITQLGEGYEHVVLEKPMIFSRSVILNAKHDCYDSKLQAFMFWKKGDVNNIYQYERSDDATGFSVAVTNLEPNTTYCYYAVCIHGVGRLESEVGELTTTSGDEPVTGSHEYVDLGLSVKWATCNIGASKPEDYGCYFAWGETSPKEVYDDDTFFDNKHEKYNNEGGKTVLDLEDDAAHVNWGGSWRMPTIVELDELCTKCTWKWGSKNGVKGYTVVGPNGNALFLPAAGGRNYMGLVGAGSRGSCWSSSLYSYYSDYAYFLNIYSSNVNWGHEDRYVGLPVRPVCPQP